MAFEINAAITDSELVEKVFARNVSEFDLQKEFGISESALRAYKKNTRLGRTRVSDAIKKIMVLEVGLSYLDKEGVEDPFAVLKQVTIDSMPLLAFINTYAKDESILLSVRQALKTRIREVRPRAIDRYRKTYGYLNDETLAKATIENPMLLKELVEDTDLRPSTRGDILEHIALGARPQFFEYVRDKTTATAPHVREAAYIGLYEYYDHDPEAYDVRNLFVEALNNEKADGVRLTIANLLEDMEG